MPAVAAGRVSGRVIVAQEELFERRRLADETAHAGVTEHADELTQAFAIDLGAQRITLDADVLDALDPPESPGSPIISALIEVRLRCRMELSEPLSMVLPARMIVTRSHNASVSARMWLDNNTVVPRSRACATHC